MLLKPFVLRGDKGIGHLFGDFAFVHDLPVFPAQHRYLLIVDVIDNGGFHHVHLVFVLIKNLLAVINNDHVAD
ncbi:hypothetical protein D3C75_1227230 [compost metagenome]